MANDTTTHVCIQDSTIRAHAEKLLKIDRTLYFGNGHPSVLAQLAIIAMQLNGILWFIRVVAAATIVQLVTFAVILFLRYSKG